MARKSVLIITYDSPYIDRRIFLFARTLNENGYDARVLSPYGAVEKGFEGIEIINLRDGAEESYSKGLFKKLAPDWLFGMARKAYKSTKVHLKKELIPLLDEMSAKASSLKADIYVACDLPALPVGCRAKEENGGALVYDAHEFFTGQSFLTKEEVRYYQGLEKDLIHKADSIITVNDDIARLFRETYGLKKVNVILNAAVPWDSKKKYLHDKINIDRDRAIVLFQGSFNKYRNLDALVKIARYFNEPVLVMLGWGELENDLKGLASRLGILDKKVFFISKLPQSELLSYSASASVGVIPYPAIDVNTVYCTPNKLFEFVSAKVPIAANEELKTVGDFIGRCDIGITFDMKDPKGAAKKIEGMLKDKALIKKIHKNLDMAGQELNWEMEGKKVIKIFSDVAGKRNSITTP